MWLDLGEVEVEERVDRGVEVLQIAEEGLVDEEVVPRVIVVVVVVIGVVVVVDVSFVDVGFVKSVSIVADMIIIAHFFISTILLEGVVFFAELSDVLGAVELFVQTCLAVFESS